MLDLEAIELIKQLKARYFRAIDTCNLDMLRAMLTEDVKLAFKSPPTSSIWRAWSRRWSSTGLPSPLPAWPRITAIPRKSRSTATRRRRCGT